MVSKEKKNIHILIIDDEPGMREFLSFELSSQGYQVTTATNGLEGLERIKTEKFQIVISDVKMPVMNGITMLENLKSMQPDIEVIMTTGHGTVENAVQAMKKGAYDFILKPFNLEELLALIERALEKSELKTLVGLYESSRAVFSTVKLEELLEIVIDLVKKVLGADEASLMLLNEENKLTIVASRGIPPEIASTVKLNIGQGIAGIAAQRKSEFLLINGLKNYPEFEKLEHNPKIRSSIVCPLMLQNEVLGVLNVNRTQQNQNFTHRDLQSALIFASHVALAVQNAKLYQTLEKKVAELESAYTALQETQTQLIHSEKLASVGRLVAGVAHEINNPLTAVIGYTQLLLETGGQDLQRQLTIIYEQAQRCGKIVQDLLVFARNKKLPDTHKPLNPCSLIDETLDGLALDMQKKSIKIKRSYAPGLSQVLGDAHQLKRVFVNMIVNASHALEEVNRNREIEISLTEKNQKVTVAFSDNGSGIPKEHLDKIFDPFFTTKEVGKGSGLGLSLSYGIIQEHGGRITVQSEPGKNTTFFIELPSGVTKKTDEQSRATETNVGRKRKKVLIVEDEEPIRELMGKILSDLGLESEAAADGNAAIQKIEATDYDLVVCDYRMPKMNGWQIFEKVKAVKPEYAKRFIFVSGSITFGEKAENIFSQNNITYVQKPFTRDQIIKAIETFFNQANMELPIRPEK